MLCACCTNVPEHVITDSQGRKWRFEQTRMFGPIVLRADGEPKVRQPGSRSAFWDAYDAWRKQHGRAP